MLVSPQSLLFRFCRILACVCCLGLFIPQVQAHPNSHYTGHTLRSADSSYIYDMFSKIYFSNDAHEIINLILDIKDEFSTTHCQYPILTDLLALSRDMLCTDGVYLDDETYEALYAELSDVQELHSTGAILVKHKHKGHHKKKEIKINSKTGIGMLKFMAGTLLCVIPIPMIQGAGASLAVLGINDMINGAREQADGLESEEKLHENQRIQRQLE